MAGIGVQKKNERNGNKNPKSKQDVDALELLRMGMF